MKNLLLFANNDGWQGIVLYFAIATIVIIVGLLLNKRRIRKEKEENENKVVYYEEIIYSKKKLLTDAEKEFYNKLMQATWDKDVILLPQINLASIIHKERSYRRNELFRNIDYGIFDKDFNVIVLIEYNDKTHLRKDRKYRDFKVKRICETANIPLITFWTDMPNEIEYMKRRINEYIEKAA